MASPRSECHRAPSENRDEVHAAGLHRQLPPGRPSGRSDGRNASHLLRPRGRAEPGRTHGRVAHAGQRREPPGRCAFETTGSPRPTDRTPRPRRCSAASTSSRRGTWRRQYGSRRNFPGHGPAASRSVRCRTSRPCAAACAPAARRRHSGRRRIVARCGWRKAPEVKGRAIPCAGTSSGSATRSTHRRTMSCTMRHCSSSERSAAIGSRHRPTRAPSTPRSGTSPKPRAHCFAGFTCMLRTATSMQVRVHEDPGCRARHGLSRDGQDDPRNARGVVLRRLRRCAGSDRGRARRGDPVRFPSGDVLLDAPTSVPSTPDTGSRLGATGRSPILAGARRCRVEQR